MARIRSIHPGLFTDEAFMTATPHARLLIIGIWTEAWDDGVFEWKPLTLKARLFPVDAVNVADLLAELEGLSVVRRFEAGKPYGAIRNFQKYQRPKKPNSSGVLPDSMGDYVGSSCRSSPPVPHQFPTSGEKSPQMEDGGWREGVKEEEAATAASSPVEPPLIEKYQDIERQCRAAAGLDNDPSPSLCVIGPIARLIDDGAVLERDILPVLREFAGKGRKGRSWSYYLQAIADGMRAGSDIKFTIPPPLSPETAAKAASLVWIDQGSDEWEAWRSAGKRWPVKDHETTKRPGWYVPSAMPDPASQAAE